VIVANKPNSSNFKGNNHNKFQPSEHQNLPRRGKDNINIEENRDGLDNLRYNNQRKENGQRNQPYEYGKRDQMPNQRNNRNGESFNEKHDNRHNEPTRFERREGGFENRSHKMEDNFQERRENRIEERQDGRMRRREEREQVRESYLENGYNKNVDQNTRHAGSQENQSQIYENKSHLEQNSYQNGNHSGLNEYGNNSYQDQRNNYQASNNNNYSTSANNDLQNVDKSTKKLEAFRNLTPEQKSAFRKEIIRHRQELRKIANLSDEFLPPLPKEDDM